jgi:hypothetical protein
LIVVFWSGEICHEEIEPFYQMAFSMGRATEWWRFIAAPILFLVINYLLYSKLKDHQG